MITKRMCFCGLVYMVSGCGAPAEQGEAKLGLYELSNHSAWDLVVRYEIADTKALAFAPAGATTQIYTTGEARRPDALQPFEVFDSFAAYRVQRPFATEVLSEVPLNWQATADSELISHFSFTIAEEDFITPSWPARPIDFYDAGQNYDFYAVNASSQNVSLTFHFWIEGETISYVIPSGESVYLGSHETPGYRYSASGMFESFALFTESGEPILSREPVADSEWITYLRSMNWAADYYDSVLVLTDDYIDGL